ncbi:MAG: hypothetical protein U1E76_24260 [Planctomycetota bacterium]
MQQPTTSHGEHEHSDVKLKPIVVFGVVLTFVSVIACVVVKYLHDLFEQQAARLDEPVHPLAEGREIPPSPRLQRTPGADWNARLEAEQQWLRGYGWVDQSQQIARIPIERAIELLVAKPPPAREKP